MLIRWAPAAKISIAAQAHREDVDRLRDRVADRLDPVDLPDPGRVEHVGARRLVGEKPLDRVVEVGVAAEEVLGPPDEHEREVERPRRVHRRRHPLDCVVEVVDAAFGVVVLDRAADRAGLGGAGDRARGVLGRRAVAVLEVGRDRQVGRPVELRDVGGDLVEGEDLVRPPEPEAEPGAGGGERLEAEARQQLGGPRVPGVGDHERLALVQSAESLAFLLLGRRHMASYTSRSGARMYSIAAGCCLQPIFRRRSRCLRESSLVARRNSVTSSSSSAVKRLDRRDSQSAAIGPQILFARE